MTTLRYAITGANGQVGSFLVNYLRQQGHIVYELARSPEKVTDSNFYKFFDLAKPEQMPSLQDVDVLIHTAYFFDTLNKHYKNINILGSQKLFQQAKIDQVKQAMFISTISAHPAAVSLYGKTKYQLEQLLLQENENTIILRPGL